ncbi:MAG: hypothetical protein GXP32_02210, partial [Kiritimatiellaeota bacterium]|nr:hypothetical protein [Kiritimatiellota bacterium]
MMRPMRDKTGVSIGKSIVFIALVLCAAALRMAEADGASSLWTDEFATYWIASASTLAECFQRASLTQGQYPLYFLLEWCVLRLFSASEFSLRLLSLAASSVSAGVVYLIASKLMESGMFADSPVVAVSPESPASSSCAKYTEETV